MKKPKINNLKISTSETNKIRSLKQSYKSVKITLNLDLNILMRLKEISSDSGVPYQRLLNKLLKESLSKKVSSDSRLDKIEKEINLLKKKIAAYL